MRGTLKTAALEHYFPLLAVEHDCILSKNAEVTVAYRVVLPELFTLTAAEYEALHGAWLKALRVLPDYTIVHKQDYFTEEHYRPDLASDESFLGRAFERHFNERPFLRHSCYLFVTKTSKEQMRRRSDFSSLCRGFIVPQEIRDTESVTLFLDAAEQMRRILCDAGFIRLEPLTADEIVGTADDSGLIARYFALGTEGIVTNEDLRLDDGQIRIGNRSLAMYTLSDLDYVPQAVGTDSRYERFSTDRSDCRLSFAAPAGLLLGHPHIYNQYVFLDNHAETLKSLEARARNMNSLARYSRANSVNKEWIDLYLNEAHTEGYRSVRCHCNVLIWADSETALKGICNDVGSQLALMGCTPHRNTVDVPALFWAGIPGAEGEFPAEESFPTFLEQALCFFAEETAYRSSPSPFGIKLVDRLSGIPLHLDISDEPIKRGITTNRCDPAVGKFRILRSEVLVRDLLSRVGIEQRAVGERFGFDSEDSALGVAENLHRNGRRRNYMPRFGFGKAASRQRSGPASKGFGRRRLRELQVERIALGFGNDQCVVIHNVIGI